MIFVGIDIAKNTHWASAMNSDGEILLEPFSFQNNNEGFQKFICSEDKSSSFRSGKSFCITALTAWRVTVLI